MYSPSLGRFIQADPIRFEGGDTNLYRFVWNNPLNFVDPTGLSGKGLHHPYPVMLGGADSTQPLFEFDAAQHTAAENVFKKYGVHNHCNLILNDAARSRWAAMTAAQQQAIIEESLRACADGSFWLA